MIDEQLLEPYMTVERALLARARPSMLTAKTGALIRSEAAKGCSADMAPGPVALEPVYEPVLCRRGLGDCSDPSMWVFERSSPTDSLRRLRIWISPQQPCEWNRSELFLKQLAGTRNRLAFEVVGCREAIVLQLLCHVEDLPMVRSAFHAEFELCVLSNPMDDPLSCVPAEAWTQAIFHDVYPPPPYSHLFTRPDELGRTPYAALLASLAEIEPPGLGFYQVVFAPVSKNHDWHQNVQVLSDLEFSVKLLGELSAYRFAQQAPSGDLRHMAMDVETKAHNDKPFFAAALRIGVVGASRGARRYLDALSVAASLIQHGGRPLNRLDGTAYGDRLSAEQVREMFVSGLTYRPGFLVNSWELTSLVHVPPVDVIEHPAWGIELLEDLPPGQCLSEGIEIGFSDHAGDRKPVCIPAGLRAQHAHLIGRSGTGKSSLMENMLLQDIEQGCGVAVLDPHGPLVQRLLCLIPESQAERVVYINPGDLDWVPIWNPLKSGAGAEPGRVTDDIVSAFKSFVTGWGDRLEHLLRHAIYGVLHLPEGSLLDVSNMLRRKAPEAVALRRQVAELVDNEVARRFWREDFASYKEADLAPVQHKISKLLTSGAVSLMLSQPESRFSLREVMDSSKVLLVDISTIGTEVREILGCFLLSLLHLAALGRAGAQGRPHAPFHICCDEAHRFLTDAMEDLIAETRKFNVSLTLAHQYMSQFATRKMDALSGVATTIIYNVDTKDAGHLKKDLRGLVDVEDLITLEVGQAIARIGNDVVRLRTHRPSAVPQDHHRDKIIAHSRAHYYEPGKHVKARIRARASGLEWCPAPVEVGPQDNDEEVFQYDVF